MARHAGGRALRAPGKGSHAFVGRRDEIAREITAQMGRPIAQSPGEVRGFEERARYMLAAAPAALGDVEPEPKPGFTRLIRREPLGLVLVLAPWNYPYLTAVNAVIPALAAGNTVLLKHSAQTPLCAERFQQAFDEAGLPPGVFQHLHLSHDAALRLAGSGAARLVAFTGSVGGGHAMQAAAGQALHRHQPRARRQGPGLCPRGCRPRATRSRTWSTAPASTPARAAAGSSASTSTSGSSTSFVAGYVELASRYVLGDPQDPATTLGPMVRPAAADHARGQVEEAVRQGARALIDTARFDRERPGSAYMAPQCLIGVTHEMRVMREESFAPIVGIMKVRGDEEAVRLMNDSPYGLTAAIWTRDEEAALRIGHQLDTGTVFMNRCDYLDPALAWTGVKDSGRGIALSGLAYEHLTRPKSFHLRHPG